jgi:DNA-binding GntR family transcriptional regulator
VTARQASNLKQKASPATLQATQALRALILGQELLPGQQIRQQEVSVRLGLSRSPVREALRTLETEGLVRHSPNVGYTVVRLTSDELSQVYLMRRALEREVLRAIRRPTETEIGELERQNKVAAEAGASGSLAEVIAANREFHFRLFQLSRLDMVRRYLEPLWALSDANRSAFLWMVEAQPHIVEEHRAMVAALRVFNVDLLVELTDGHRHWGESKMLNLLSSDTIPLS